MHQDFYYNIRFRDFINGTNLLIFWQTVLISIRKKYYDFSKLSVLKIDLFILPLDQPFAK